MNARESQRIAQPSDTGGVVARLVNAVNLAVDGGATAPNGQPPT